MAMAAQWYYSHGGKTYGPVTSQQLRDLANRGMILPDDMVWKEGVAEGVPAKTVKGLFPDGSAASSPPTSTATTTPKGGSASVGWSGMASSSSSTGPSDFDDDDTDYRLMRKRKAYGKQLLLDYLFFRRMISPILIQIFFWVG
ncbi:MAG: DUF4339 domain-containing protein, partial [Gemmataceae bacterium]|nr:DUF4339 domain-containing protein [Gemmataceae bacterium]